MMRVRSLHSQCHYRHCQYNADPQRLLLKKESCVVNKNRLYVVLLPNSCCSQNSVVLQLVTLLFPGPPISRQKGSCLLDFISYLLFLACHLRMASHPTNIVMCFYPTGQPRIQVGNEPGYFLGCPAISRVIITSLMRGTRPDYLSDRADKKN